MNHFDNIERTKAKKRNTNLSETIYESIKNKIIIGELAAKTALLERKIAAEFGVSRTPVREALKRLYQEGWVDWQEHHRASVSVIKDRDVVELFLLRKMIEPFAFKRIIKFGEPQLLAGVLVTILKNMEDLQDKHIEFMKKDMVFHSTIIDFTGIEKLSQMWQKISDEMTRVAIFALHDKGRRNNVILEHKAIIDAFWDNDVEKALSAINLHHFNIQSEYKIKQNMSIN